MTVISLKDYAAEKGISYEAVRQQVVRYKDQLEPHIIRDGRQQFLDEEAVAFLDAKRMKNLVAIIQQDKNEQIEELENQVKQLLAKIASQADRISELSQWKADHALALAEADQTRMLLESTRGQLSQLEQAVEQKVAEARQEAVEATREALEAEHTQELQNVQKKIQGQLDAAVEVFNQEKKLLEDQNHLLQNELQGEKNRKLTLRERFLGRKSQNG